MGFLCSSFSTAISDDGNITFHCLLHKTINESLIYLHAIQGKLNMHAFILTAGHVLFVWAIHFSLWTCSRNRWIGLKRKRKSLQFQLMEAEMFRSLKPTTPWFAKFAMGLKPNCISYTWKVFSPFGWISLLRACSLTQNYYTWYYLFFLYIYTVVEIAVCTVWSWSLSLKTLL